MKAIVYVYWQMAKMYLCSKEVFAGITKDKQNKIPLTELNADGIDVEDFRKALGI